MASQHGLMGYRRPNGAVGSRNIVAVLPVDDLSNAAAEGVAAVVPGCLALPHAYGRLQFGPDLELTFDTLIGMGSNPNVAAVVVIGIEPNWTNRVAKGIEKSGKPVHAVSIEAAATSTSSPRPRRWPSRTCRARARSCASRSSPPTC